MVLHMFLTICMYSLDRLELLKRWLANIHKDKFNSKVSPGMKRTLSESQQQNRYSTLLDEVRIIQLAEKVLHIDRFKSSLYHHYLYIFT